MSYYILSNEPKKRILATKSFDDAFEFIKKNNNCKIKTMDWRGKPKVIDKRKFIMNFYDASNQETKDKKQVFVLIEILTTGFRNIAFLVKQMDLKQDYKEYRKLIKDKL